MFVVFRQRNSIFVNNVSVLMKLNILVLIKFNDASFTRGVKLGHMKN